MQWWVWVAIAMVGMSSYRNGGYRVSHAMVGMGSYRNGGYE